MTELAARIADELRRLLFIEIEASGRHVHLTKRDAQLLFGHPLTKKAPLSQPGQFVTEERVTLIGPRGELERVAVLGPERDRSQVEISLTDARLLGIDAPVRLSGDLSGTPGLRLRGEFGEIELPDGVIVAQRHLHITPPDAERFGVTDGQEIRLRALSERPTIFDGVKVRVSSKAATRVHIDYDEANACGFRKGDLGLIVS